MAMNEGRRDGKKEAYWRRLINRWRSSGRPVNQFCRSAGVSEALFYYWRRTISKRDGGARKRAGRVFVPVRVAQDAPADTEGRLEIILAGGWCVRVSGRVEPQMLAEVLAVVEGRGC